MDRDNSVVILVGMEVGGGGSRYGGINGNKKLN